MDSEQVMRDGSSSRGRNKRGRGASRGRKSPAKNPVHTNNNGPALQRAPALYRAHAKNRTNHVDGPVRIGSRPSNLPTYLRMYDCGTSSEFDSDSGISSQPTGSPAATSTQFCDDETQVLTSSQKFAVLENAMNSKRQRTDHSLSSILRSANDTLNPFPELPDSQPYASYNQETPEFDWHGANLDSNSAENKNNHGLQLNHAELERRRPQTNSRRQRQSSSIGGMTVHYPPVPTAVNSPVAASLPDIDHEQQTELERQRQQTELERQRQQTELERQRQQAEMERHQALLDRERQQVEVERHQALLNRERQQSELERQQQQAELDRQRQQAELNRSEQQQTELTNMEHLRDRTAIGGTTVPNSPSQNAVYSPVTDFERELHIAEMEQQMQYTTTERHREQSEMDRLHRHRRPSVTSGTSLPYHTAQSELQPPFLHPSDTYQFYMVKTIELIKRLVQDLYNRQDRQLGLNRHCMCTLSDFSNIAQRFNFPMSTPADVEALESKLVDVDQQLQLKLVLLRMGGEQLSSVVYRIMDRLFTLGVGAQYTWTGKSSKGRKKAFTDLPHLFSCIKDAVFLNGQITDRKTDDNVQHYISEWLRHCNGRLSSASQSGTSR